MRRSNQTYSPLHALTQHRACKALKKHRMIMSHFFGGKSPEAKACKGFEMSQIEEISVEGRGNRIKPIPLYVAAPMQHHWLRWSENTVRCCWNFWRVNSTRANG